MTYNIHLNYKNEVQGFLAAYIIAGVICGVVNLLMGWAYFSAGLFLIGFLTFRLQLNQIQFRCKNCGKRVYVKKTDTTKQCITCETNHTIEWKNNQPFGSVISPNYKLAIYATSLLLIVPAIYEFVSNYMNS